MKESEISRNYSRTFSKNRSFFEEKSRKSKEESLAWHGNLLKNINRMASKSRKSKQPVTRKSSNFAKRIEEKEERAKPLKHELDREENDPGLVDKEADVVRKDAVKRPSTGTGLSDTQKKATKNRKVSESKYDSDGRFIWEFLDDKANYEEVNKFKGGFAEVLILKSKKNGEMIVVKKNCKGDNAEFDTATCMAIPLIFLDLVLIFFLFFIKIQEIFLGLHLILRAFLNFCIF